jgi:predicted metal-dependent hydrolase
VTIATVTPDVRSRWRDSAELKEHARAWAERIGVKPSRVQVQSMKTKWASCSTLGAISFSTDLLLERRSFGEAVIVHELLHLKVRNHGPVFRSLLRAYLPSHDELSAVSCERPVNRRRTRRGRV